MTIYGSAPAPRAPEPTDELATNPVGEAAVPARVVVQLAEETHLPNHRPTDDSAEQLGFRKAKMVHWLSPRMLANTAIQVIISDTFGELLDKRELEAQLPARIHDERPEGRDDAGMWFDYMADSGDGFNPTYTIAFLLAQDHLSVNGESLQRGRFLMMGGDQVYPTPSKLLYDEKLKGPYKAALPVPPVGHRPAMYALPGNHDWYDGLSSFLRLFVKDDKDNIGGWRNAQARSYFGIKLTHHWWMLAVDTQFGVYIDDAQLDYFRTVAAQMEPGDRIIVCAPSPSWVEAVWEPGSYDAIDFFLRTVIFPTGAHVKVMLSGDLHHYARYETESRQLIHCGGGGAYLYPTHHMPTTIPVPPPPSNAHDHRGEPTRDYRLANLFPSRKTSRGYAAGVLWRTPLKNPGFIGLIGTLQTLFMLSLLGIFTDVSSVAEHWLELPVAVIAIAILYGSIAFARSPGSAHGKAAPFILGGIHGFVQIGLGIVGTMTWADYGYLHGNWPAPLVAVLGYLIVSGVVATLIFCVYLLIASAFGVNLNELFSSQSIVDSKSFLRMNIDETGALNIYPIKVPRVSRRWRARPEAGPAHSWLEPADKLEFGLAEPKIVVR